MSSELHMFDNSFYSDPFSQFPFEIFHEIEGAAAAASSQPPSGLDELAAALLSSSPPSAELRSLSLSQLAGAEHHPGSEVKTEECHVSFENFPSLGNSFSPHETALKLMQRSYSSNSFDMNSHNFTFRPQFDSVFENSQDLHPQILTSPETAFHSGQMRRASSTGDLHKMKMNMHTRTVLSSSPLSAEKSFMEEANFKVGRYSAEERKERIDRYRAKRTQRNFNKTIKYACRKTLADTRPRIRGRFARNDETGETPKASMMFQRYEDDDDIWMALQMEGLHEEENEEQIARRGTTFFNVTDCSQYQNYRY